MPASAEALFVLFILLPGLLAQRVAEALTPKEPRDTLSRIVGALVFIFPVYGLYWAIGYLLQLFFGITISRFPVEPLGPTKLPIIHVGSTFLLLALATGWGLFWGWLLESGTLYKVLNRLGITHSTGKDTAWEDAFSERTYENYVRVYLKDGRVIAGYARYVSHPPHRREIFIESIPEFPATIIWPDGEIYRTSGVGFLITDEDQIEMVEFV